MTNNAKKPQERKKLHRPMPEDPRLLAKAMFDAANRKIEEARAAEKPAAQKRQVRLSNATGGESVL